MINFKEATILYYKLLKNFSSYKEVVSKSIIKEKYGKIKSFLILHGLGKYKFIRSKNLPTEYLLLETELHNIKTHLQLAYLEKSGYSEWLNIVCYEFAKFVRYAEKCFMYGNSDSNVLFVEEDKDGNSISIFFIFDNYKAKIRFSKLSLNNDKRSPLDRYLDSIIYDESLLYEIEIIRLFGKQMKNSFKFIYADVDDNSKLSDDDKLLLERFKIDSIKYIIKEFSKIMNSITYFYDMNIDYEEVITDGFWVR